MKFYHKETSYECEFEELTIREFIQNFKPCKVQQKRGEGDEIDKSTINPKRVKDYAKDPENLFDMLSSLLAPIIVTCDGEILQGNHRFTSATLAHLSGKFPERWWNRKFQVLRLKDRLPPEVYSYLILIANRTAKQQWQAQVLKGDFPISKNWRVVSEIIGKLVSPKWAKSQNGMALALHLTVLFEDETNFAKLLNGQYLEDLEPHKVYEVAGRADLNTSVLTKIPNHSFERVDFKRALQERLTSGLTLLQICHTELEPIHGKSTHLRWILPSLSLAGKILGGPSTTRHSGNWKKLKDKLISPIITKTLKDFSHQPKSKAAIVADYLLGN